ncbi:hypothetical protein [Neobacillus jeddahensis]|uniref:hypothetical protein n=1 Tax=Neobacillus jeddahensis TaxID=1461580 RepID=UPI00058E3D7D|nr:hypothetical protein [Neobacillus jeddahensis]
MTIPGKYYVINKLSEKYECNFSPIKRKQIMYGGINRGDRIVVCTPSSKIHARGHGWFDLTTVQVKLLDDADVAILAIRLMGKKVYFVNFKDLRKLMTIKNMHTNTNEGEHWKFYVWDDYIEVRGNHHKFLVTPKIVES